MVRGVELPASEEKHKNNSDRREGIKVYKIMVMRLGGIGDVLMTTALLEMLKETFPSSHVTYIVGSAAAKALKNNPRVDALKVIDENIFFKKQKMEFWKLTEWVKKQRFDMSLTLDKHVIFATLVYFAKVKLRVGFVRDKLSKHLLHKKVEYDGTLHELQYYSKIAEAASCYAYRTTPVIYKGKGDEADATHYFDKHNIKISIGLAVGGCSNPGQDAPMKKWPTTRYAELAKKISANGRHVLIFGGPGDIGEAKYFEFNKRVHNLIGLDVQRTAAYVDNCDFFISHDTASLHIASATNTHIVALFGPTPNQRFAPSGSVIIQSKACRPCYNAKGEFKKCNDYKCMRGISVEEVFDHVS
jgi:ADP-heptose:LPS heptosyltransferase